MTESRPPTLIVNPADDADFRRDAEAALRGVAPLAISRRDSDATIRESSSVSVRSPGRCASYGMSTARATGSHVTTGGRSDG